MDNNNPYQTPQAPVVDADAEQPRSKMPKYLGIVLLVMSGFGVLGLFFTIALLVGGDADMQAALTAQGVSMQYLFISTTIGVLASIWMIYISIQLLRYRDRGRKHLGYYMIYMLVITPLTLLYQWFMLDTVLPGMFGSVFGILLYGLFWYLLNQDKAKASLT